MAFSADVSMGQVFNVVNDYEQSRKPDTIVLQGDTGIRTRTRQGQNEQPNMNPIIHGDTGIKIRTRQGQNEQPNVNPMIQGIAPRRIRLGGVVTRSFGSKEMAKDGSCAPEYHSSETIIAGVRSLFI